MISGSQIKAVAKTSPPKSDVAAGDGPAGGLLRMGQSVVVWGLPFKQALNRIHELVKEFKLADMANPIVQIATCASTVFK